MRKYKRFQSTRPIRGATTLSAILTTSLFISIHAPHTGRDTAANRLDSSESEFQSTRPIRGATTENADCTTNKQFQSTRPIRGATNRFSDDMFCNDISIHAPHTGRDSFFCTYTLI